MSGDVSPQPEPAPEPHVAGIGDRISSTFRFIDFLRGISDFIDLSQMAAITAAIRQLTDQTQPLDTPEGLREACRDATALLVAVSRATVTDRDDPIADKLKQITENGPLFNFLVDLVAKLIAQRAAGEEIRVNALDALCTSDERQVLDAQAINIDWIMQMVALVSQLLELFRNR